MGAVILVAGAGHGGLSAAYNLAKNGYDVTVYEKSAEDNLGHEWSDYFSMKAFASAGFPLPHEGVTDKAPIAYYCPDPSVPPLYEPNQEGFDMYMPRRDVYRHLIKHCREAGVKFVFECTIKGPIILGNRVVGLDTEKGVFLGDLIIDAAGFSSAVRNGLPRHFMVEHNCRKYDQLYAYRGIFERSGEKLQGPWYKVAFDFDENNDVCLKWNVTYDDYVDIFIGRSKPFSMEKAEETVEEMRKIFPYIGKKLIRGGKFAVVPIRQSPAVIVADGYAAVGDSAMMTLPVLGSGISISLRAGKLLANAIMADKDKCFSIKTLWNYQVSYFKKIGFNLGAIALLKSLIPSLTREDIIFFFNSGVLSGKDMTFSDSATSLSELLPDVSIPDLIDRIKKATANPSLIKKVAGVGVEFVKYKTMVATFPSKYEREAVEKWEKKYTGFFANVVDKSNRS